MGIELWFSNGDFTEALKEVMEEVGEAMRAHPGMSKQAALRSLYSDHSNPS